MSFFLFVDESGQDQTNSPYEVLAGVSVEDRDLWNLITALHQCEVAHFGRRYTEGERELKGRHVLNRRTFVQAALQPSFSAEERTALARACLDSGATSGIREIAALAQAKIHYAREVLITAARFRCKCFASIVDRDAPRPSANYLRKDYAYLFERFYYFLEDIGGNHSGVVVFDEREKSACHILLDQMHRYFRETAKGRQRSALIVPEAFFVHSDLTTGIQLADLAAYILCWGARTPSMTRPHRPELSEHARLILDMRHSSIRPVGTNQEFKVWSLAIIKDLRASIEQEQE